MKIIYETLEQHDGWVVRRFIDGGRPLYVKKIYRGEYTFTRDYLYAKTFASEKTAMGHIVTLAIRDKVQPADFITVHVDRRDS